MSSMTGAGGFGSTGKTTPFGETGYQSVVSQKFTPEQMNLFQQMFGQVGPESYLGKLAGGDQSQFEQMERPAMRQFGEQQSGMASRYSAPGVGSRRTSGFQNEQTSASQNFAQQLQAQRQGIQQSAIKQLQEMSQNLLGQSPYEQHIMEPEQQGSSFWDKLLGGLSSGAGMAGGLFGGQAAGRGMSALSGLFGNKSGSQTRNPYSSY